MHNQSRNMPQTLQVHVRVLSQTIIVALAVRQSRTLIYTMHYDDAEAHQLFLRESLHRSLLAETLQYRVDVVKGLVDFRPYFGTCEHDFSRYKDEQDDTRLHHAVDESRKELGLVT